MPRPAYRVIWRQVPPPAGHDPLRAVAEAIVAYQETKRHRQLIEETRAYLEAKRRQYQTEKEATCPAC